MNAKAFAPPLVLSTAALLVLAVTAANAQRSAASNSAVLTLYNVASSRKVESGDISFNSISSAAASQIENWARLEHVPISKYVFNGRGYTLVYGGKSYDCFRYPTTRGHSLVCVGDDGTFLGSVAAPSTAGEPPQ
jgi:hypothetical protein